MKKLLLPLLLAGAPAFAQLPALHARPEKNDDTIVLTLPDEGRAVWQRAAGVLAARGYTFRYSDAACSLSVPTMSAWNRTTLLGYLCGWKATGCCCVGVGCQTMT